MPTSAFKRDLDDGAPSKITQGGKAEFSIHLLPYHEDTTSCFLPLGICRTLLLIVTSELMSSSYFLLFTKKMPSLISSQLNLCLTKLNLNARNRKLLLGNWNSKHSVANNELGR